MKFSKIHIYIQEIKWDVSSSKENLFVLYSNCKLVIWQADKGVRLWSKTFTETLNHFTIDPHEQTRLARKYKFLFDLKLLYSFVKKCCYSSFGSKFHSIYQNWFRERKLSREMAAKILSHVERKRQDSGQFQEFNQYSYKLFQEHEVFFFVKRCIKFSIIKFKS